MPYVQVEVPGGYITRNLTISINARSSGYPGYLVTIQPDRDLVRTILWLDDGGNIWLTDEEEWALGVIDAQRLIFSPDPNIDKVSIRVGSPLYSGGPIVIALWPWNSIWANMKTDDPRRNGLLWPLRSWQEAWSYIRDMKYLVAMRDVSGLWVAPVDAFGGNTTGPVGFAWKQASFDAPYKPASFRLLRGPPTPGVSVNGRSTPMQYESWGLIYMGEGVTSGEQLLAEVRGVTTGLILKGWDAGGAYRWMLSDTIADAMYFKVQSVHNQQYNLSYLGMPLSKAYAWQVKPWPSPRVFDGVEFFNGGMGPVTLIILDQLSMRERYLLGSYVQYASPTPTTETIPENMPRGTGLCTTAEWDGTILDCWGRRAPYPASMGQTQCQTLADMSIDPHCQEWVQTMATRSSADGQQMDSLLKGLCSGADAKDHMDVCACYLPDDVYYQAIVDRHSDPEMGRTIADTVRASNILPCASGLCTGQEGSFSPDVYYRGARRCDICIQAISTNIKADTIQGDINIRQVCTQVDASYTWSDLIDRLEELGASRITDTGMDGIFRHVIINRAGTAIKFMTTTSLGMKTMSGLTLLSAIKNKDADGNTILTEDMWRTNNTRYSEETLLFFLEAREA